MSVIYRDTVSFQDTPNETLQISFDIENETSNLKLS
jgi:hypothetical protein